MMETNETLLRTELGTINDGSEITTAQLLRLQYLIARYTVTATTFANIIKEMSDSLKRCCLENWVIGTRQLLA